MSITRMLRATVIGRTVDAEGILTAIQAAGLLHITPMRPPDDVSGLVSSHEGVLALVSRLQRARAAIASTAEAPPEADNLAVDTLAHRVGEALDRRERLVAEHNAAQATVSALEPWGEIDPLDLDALAAHGAEVTFVRLTPTDYRLIDWTDIAHTVAHTVENEIYVAIFSKGATELPSTPLRLPRLKLSEAVATRDALAASLRSIETFLGSQSHRIPDIDRRLGELGDRAAVLTALSSGLDEGPLFAVQGFLPAENQSDLQKAILPFSAGLKVDDPEPGSPVPVKLKHARPIGGFGRIVREFSGISYWEKDFTPIVMILFMVFGSLCLVDAGYGLMLAATGAWLVYKGNRAFGNVFIWTGAFSFLVGVLGGSYFGLVVGKDVLVGHAPPTQLAADPMTTFIFSLVVGLLTMTTAYATAIWQRGWKTVATGSLLVALGAIAMAISRFAADRVAGLIVSSPGPAEVASVTTAVGTAGAIVGGAGILAWLLWPDPVFGPKSHVANVLWTLYSGLTGLGQDVMSHMRLFGIGLSGAIMASVINTMAAMLPLPGTIIAAVLGHAFVFVLSLLSLYIHTNRLIFLEFGSKCFDGGQAWYEPLRRRGAPADLAA